MLPFQLGGAAGAPLFMMDEQGLPMMMPLQMGGGGEAGAGGVMPGLPDLGAALQAALGGAGPGAMQPLALGGGGGAAMAPLRQPAPSGRPASYGPVPTLLRQLQLGARSHWMPLATVYLSELTPAAGQPAPTTKDVSARLGSLMESMARETGRPPMMLVGGRALHAYEERINCNSKPTVATLEGAVHGASSDKSKGGASDGTAASEHEQWLIAPLEKSLGGRAFSRRFKRLERRPDVMPPRIEAPVPQQYGPRSSHSSDDDDDADDADAAAEDQDEECDHDHDAESEDEEADDEGEDDEDESDGVCTMCRPLISGPTSDENNDLPYMVLCEEIRFALWISSAAAATIMSIRVEGAPLLDVPVEPSELLREKKKDMLIQHQQQKLLQSSCPLAPAAPKPLTSTPIPLNWLRPQPGTRIIVDLQVNRPGCSGLVSALPSPLRTRSPDDPLSDGDDDDPLSVGRPCIGQCCKPRIVFEIVASPPFKSKVTAKPVAKPAAGTATAAASSSDASAAPALDQSPLIAPAPVLPLGLAGMTNQTMPLLQPSPTEGSQSNSPDAVTIAAANDAASSSALPAAASSSLAPLSRSASLQPSAISSPGAGRLSAYSQAYALSKHFYLPMLSCNSMTSVVPPSYPLLHVQEDLKHVFPDAIALLPLPLAYALTRSQVDSPACSSERTLFELDFMRRILPSYALVDAIDAVAQPELVLSAAEATTVLSTAIAEAAIVPVCIKCGATAGVLRCGPCKAPYCSAACQKAHWAQHRQACRRPLTVKLRPLKLNTFSAETCRALYSLRAHELIAQHAHKITKAPDYFGRAKPSPMVRDRLVPHRELHQLIAEIEAEGVAAAVPTVHAVLDEQGRVDAARWQRLPPFDRLRVLRQEALVIVLERFLLLGRLRPYPSWLALQWLYSRAMRHLISSEGSAGLVHDFAVREWPELRRLKLQAANCLRTVMARLAPKLTKRPATPVDTKMMSLAEQRESPEEARWRAYQQFNEDKKKQAEGSSSMQDTEQPAAASMHELALGSNTAVSQLPSLASSGSPSDFFSRAMSSNDALLLRIGSCLPLSDFLALSSVTRSTHRWQQQRVETWSHLYAIMRWGQGRIGQAEVSTLMTMHAAATAAAAVAASSASSALVSASNSPQLISRQNSTEALVSRMFDLDDSETPQRSSAADDGKTPEEEDAGRAEKRSRTDADLSRTASLSRTHSDEELSAAVASAAAAAAASAPASSSGSSDAAFLSWARYLKYRLSHRKALLFSGATKAGPDRLFPVDHAKLSPPFTSAQHEELDLLAASMYCWRSPSTRAPSGIAQSARLLDPYTERTRLPKFIFPLPSLQANVGAMGPIKVHSTADLRVDEAATARAKLKNNSSSSGAGGAANAAAAANAVGTVATLTDRLLVGSHPFLDVSLLLHQYTPHNPNAQMAWLMAGDSSLSGKIQTDRSSIRSGELGAVLHQLGLNHLLEPHLALVLMTIQSPTIATNTLINRALRSTNPDMIRFIGDPHVLYRLAFSIHETSCLWIGHRASPVMNQIDYLRQFAMQNVRAESKHDKFRSKVKQIAATMQDNDSSSSNNNDAKQDENKSDSKEAESAEKAPTVPPPAQSSAECSTGLCVSPTQHHSANHPDVVSPSGAASSAPFSISAAAADEADDDSSTFGSDCTCPQCVAEHDRILEICAMNVLELPKEDQSRFFEAIQHLFDVQPVRALVLRGAFFSPEQLVTLLRILAGSKRASQTIERLIFMLPYPALNLDHTSDDPAAVASRDATQRRLRREADWLAWQSQEKVREKLHARLTKEEASLQLARSEILRYTPMMVHIIDHLPHDHPAVLKLVEKAEAAGKPNPISGMTSPYTLAPFESLDGKFKGTASQAYKLMRARLKSTHAQIKQLRTNIKALRGRLLAAAATQKALDTNETAASSTAASSASSIAAAAAPAAAAADAALDDEEEKANAAEDDDDDLDEDGENADQAQQNAFMNQIGLGAAGLGNAPDGGALGGGGLVGAGGAMVMPLMVNPNGDLAGVGGGADGAAGAGAGAAIHAAGGGPGPANVNFGYVDLMLGPNGELQVGGGGMPGGANAGVPGGLNAQLQNAFMQLFGGMMGGGGQGGGMMAGAPIVFDHGNLANAFLPQLPAPGADPQQPQDEQAPVAELAPEANAPAQADGAAAAAVAPEPADSPMEDASALAHAEPSASSSSAVVAPPTTASSSSSSAVAPPSMVSDVTSTAFLECVQALLATAPRLRQIRAAHEADLPPTDLLSLNLQVETPDSPDAVLPAKTHALFSRGGGPHPESTFSFAPASSLRSSLLAASLLHAPSLSHLRYFDSLPVSAIIANRTKKLDRFSGGIGSLEFDVLCHLLRSNTSVTSVDLQSFGCAHSIRYLPRGATTDPASAKAVMVHPMLITLQEDDEKGRKQATSAEDDYEADQRELEKSAEAAAKDAATAAAAAALPKRGPQYVSAASMFYGTFSLSVGSLYHSALPTPAEISSFGSRLSSAQISNLARMLRENRGLQEFFIEDLLEDHQITQLDRELVATPASIRCPNISVVTFTSSSLASSIRTPSLRVSASPAARVGRLLDWSARHDAVIAAQRQVTKPETLKDIAMHWITLLSALPPLYGRQLPAHRIYASSPLPELLWHGSVVEEKRPWSLAHPVTAAFLARLQAPYYAALDATLTHDVTDAGHRVQWPEHLIQLCTEYL